jgi:hypothetical protein
MGRARFTPADSALLTHGVLGNSQLGPASAGLFRRTTQFTESRKERHGSTACSHLERRVSARLIVPTHLVKQIGRLLVSGMRESVVSMPEDARLR